MRDTMVFQRDADGESGQAAMLSMSSAAVLISAMQGEAHTPSKPGVGSASLKSMCRQFAIQLLSSAWTLADRHGCDQVV